MLVSFRKTNLAAIWSIAFRKIIAIMTGIIFSAIVPNTPPPTKYCKTMNTTPIKNINKNKIVKP